MNKVQLVSSIMKTMKNKEGIKFKLKVEASAQETELNFSKVFEPDKKPIHGRCHHGYGLMHGGYHGHMRGMMGMRDKLSMMSTALDLFNSIQVTDLEDGGEELTLNNKDLPEELIERIKEGMKSKHIMMHKMHFDNMSEDEKTAIEEHFGGHHIGEHHEIKKMFKELDNATFDLKVIVNRNKEVTELAVQIAGETEARPCRMKASATAL